MNNKPRNSSTNKRVLSARSSTSSRAQVATGNAPYITVGKAANQPPPIPQYRDKWVKRTYQVNLKSSGTNPVTLAANSFGPTVAGDLAFLDKLSVWCCNTAQNTGLTASLNQGYVTDSGIQDPVTSQDWGSSMALPGTTFKVPTGHAKAIDLHDTGSICTASTIAAVADQWFCFQADLWVSI